MEPCPKINEISAMKTEDPDADHRAFEEMAEKSNSITETLNHIMNSVNFDCNTCNLKPICDEVEGMRELHFKSRGM